MPRVTSLAAPSPVELRVEVRPPWPFKLRGGSPDGLFRRRGAVVQRLLHVDGEPVLAGAVQLAPDRVAFGARAAGAAAAREGLRRMRFATGVDDDQREFHERFRGDRFIGRALRELPHLRVRRKPDPWEALAWAITEQLIEFDRAVAIQRRLTAVLGRRCPDTGLRDAPAAAVIAAEAPARLASFDLPQHRAITLRRAALEVARGRVDLAAPDHEAGWRRLRTIAGIGPWTVEMLALMGQGRDDQVPAGDLGYIKLVGRLTTGHPKARADVDEVRGFFAPYGAFKGLAGEYLRAAAAHGWLPAG
jgi:3-methyladenine DNA glycosylase/8-oxoguanine DNA glycosylase